MNQNKLQNFLERLSDSNVPAEQQSYLLTPSDSDLTAGDNLGGACVNDMAGACDGKNDYCTNYTYCVGSTNYKRCENYGKRPIGIEEPGEDWVRNAEFC